MNDVLADTNSVVWFLFDAARISPPADAALSAASQLGKLYTSAITLVEAAYLSRKKLFSYHGVCPRPITLTSDH